MKSMASKNGYQQLVERLIDLPNKIIENHELEHLPQVVLHYLGHDDCFGLEKAAYFADNPDFDHLLGAAGYCKKECDFSNVDEIWSSPNSYAQRMDHGDFHKKVQKVLRNSLRKKHLDITNADDIMIIAQELEIEPAEFISWNLKHGNHGVLIYQPNYSLDEWQGQLFKKAVEFLGFCPI